MLGVSLTMRKRPSFLLFTAGLLLVGCGASAPTLAVDKGGEDGGGGTAGGGGSGGSPSPSAGAGGSGVSSSSSSTGSAFLTCDELASCGNTGQGCVACAVDGPCADAYQACFNSDDCVKYGTCFDMCAGDPACADTCDQQLPAGKDAYAAYFQCVICKECKTSCGPMQLCPPSP
jgi:hypothetical protein